MIQRRTFAMLLLFISIVMVVSLYGWVTAVPAYPEPVAIPLVVDWEDWSEIASPLLETPMSDAVDSIDLSKNRP